MFERFTERARRVAVLAQDEARMLGHDHIGTGHILLGLIREGDGAGAPILWRQGLDPNRVRRKVTQFMHLRPAGLHYRHTPQRKTQATGPDRISESNILKNPSKEE